MRYLVIFLVLTTTFLPDLAFGQEYERYRLPLGRRCSLASETYQCFNLDEYRELLLMDEDLRNLDRLHAADIQRLVLLTNASEELTASLESANSTIELLESERLRLTAMWEEENRLRHEAENRPDWNWIPWTLAGGLAIAVVVLSLILGIP